MYFSKVIFKLHNRTKQGEFWVLNANDNGFVRKDSESRKQFECRVLKALFQYIGMKEYFHKENGAPFLTDQESSSISISHSDNWFALYVSENGAVGIDIEIPSSRVESVKNQFLSASELERIQPNSSQLQLLWGVKECVFKKEQGKIQNFKTDIQVQTLSESSAEVVFGRQVIQLSHIVCPEFVLVYTN